MGGGGRGANFLTRVTLHQTYVAKGDTKAMMLLFALSFTLLYVLSLGEGRILVVPELTSWGPMDWCWSKQQGGERAEGIFHLILPKKRGEREARGIRKEASNGPAMEDSRGLANAFDREEEEERPRAADAAGGLRDLFSPVKKK